MFERSLTSTYSGGNKTNEENKMSRTLFVVFSLLVAQAVYAADKARPDAKTESAQLSKQFTTGEVAETTCSPSASAIQAMNAKFDAEYGWLKAKFLRFIGKGPVYATNYECPKR
jgi:hypothetical protein